MTIKPLSDRVLIKLEKAEEETTAGGLILMNNSATGEPVTAKVVACGPGQVSASGTVVPMTVKVGDTVLVNKSAGQTIKIDGEELVLLYESEIIAVAE